MPAPNCSFVTWPLFAASHSANQRSPNPSNSARDNLPSPFHSALLFCGAAAYSVQGNRIIQFLNIRQALQSCPQNKIAIAFPQLRMFKR